MTSVPNGTPLAKVVFVLTTTGGIEAKYGRPAMARPSELVVGPDARWVLFGQRRIKLEKHLAPRRIFARLCELARHEPHATLTVAPLFEAGWPGESIRFESRVKRVHTAIWTLRKLGLAEVLHTRGGGYCVEAAVRFA